MMNIPRWALPGGQMYADPRVAHMRFLTEQAKSIAPTLDEDRLFSDLLVDDVQYVRPSDQDEAQNMNYAPIECAGEFYVLADAMREERRWTETLTAEVERDDQPAWIDPFEDIYPDTDDEDDELFEFVPGTSPYQEFIDNQRSKMVDNIYAAKQRGKKWADSKALLVVALAALDKGKSFQRARELGFMAYHCQYAPNIVKRVEKGFVVKTTTFENGKPKDTWRFMGEEWIRLCWDFLPKTSKKRIRALTLGS